jgi:signal transduction histidine kinase
LRQKDIRTVSLNLCSEALEGTGVGLFIVQKVMCLRGGKELAEGNVGKGDIFFFTQH